MCLCYLCFSLSVFVCLPVPVSPSFWKISAEVLVELSIKPGAEHADFPVLTPVCKQPHLSQRLDPVMNEVSSFRPL